MFRFELRNFIQYSGLIFFGIMGLLAFQGAIIAPNVFLVSYFIMVAVVDFMIVLFFTSFLLNDDDYLISFLKNILLSCLILLILGVFLFFSPASVLFLYAGIIMDRCLMYVIINFLNGGEIGDEYTLPVCGMIAASTLIISFLLFPPTMAISIIILDVATMLPLYLFGCEFITYNKARVPNNPEIANFVNHPVIMPEEVRVVSHRELLQAVHSELLFKKDPTETIGFNRDNILGMHVFSSPHKFTTVSQDWLITTLKVLPSEVLRLISRYVVGERSITIGSTLYRSVLSDSKQKDIDDTITIRASIRCQRLFAEIKNTSSKDGKILDTNNGLVYSTSPVGFFARFFGANKTASSVAARHLLPLGEKGIINGV